MSPRREMQYNKTAPGPATGRQAPSDVNETVNAGGGAKGGAAETLVAPTAVVATPAEEPSSAAVVGDAVDDASKSS